MTDGLSTLYQDLLGGSYDCVDRIVLNAYFRMGHDPGGFRVWWRALTGSDETLENAYLMRLARHCAPDFLGPREVGIGCQQQDLEAHRHSSLHGLRREASGGETALCLGVKVRRQRPVT